MIAFYNGCRFESLGELKYALSIEDEYAYIVHPKKIFDSFYRDHGKIVEIYEHTKGYTPDFLIRSYRNNTASFVEVKYEDFNDVEQIELRNRIMGKYLTSLPTPLTFKWVRWNNNMLPQSKHEKLSALLENQHYERKFHDRVKDIYNRNEKVPYTFPNVWSDREYVDFVIHGINPLTNRIEDQDK
ncbi:MAG: hypothetical protein ACOYXT_29115 [Bacteroidota bacterium]